MVFWTVLPLELVFGGEDKPPEYTEIDYSGIKIVVEKFSAEECRIVRVLSTEPQDFLRPEFQPGRVLSYQPVLTAIG